MPSVELGLARVHNGRRYRLGVMGGTFDPFIMATSSRPPRLRPDSTSTRSFSFPPACLGKRRDAGFRRPRIATS